MKSRLSVGATLCGALFFVIALFGGMCLDRTSALVQSSATLWAGRFLAVSSPARAAGSTNWSNNFDDGYTSEAWWYSPDGGGIDYDKGWAYSPPNNGWVAPAPYNVGQLDTYAIAYTGGSQCTVDVMIAASSDIQQGWYGVWGHYDDNWGIIYGEDVLPGNNGGYQHYFGTFSPPQGTIQLALGFQIWGVPAPGGCG
jgi:hypothetical protein